jgi:hypothetical protein
MRKPLDCCLTIVCHESMEERLVDHLLEHPDLVSGFSIARIEGHSRKENLPSMMERVRGRSRRIEIRTVMNQADAADLIVHLKEEEANPDVAYWLSPVTEFGRLA